MTSNVVEPSFHNRPHFEWLTKRAGRPFWDTSKIGDEKARLSIYDIDRRLAPQFPMVGPVAPDEVLMSVDGWVGVVDRAHPGRGYSKERIRKFLGGNLMRVFRQVTSNPG